MTVAELIEELNKVEDKSKKVGLYDPMHGECYFEIAVSDGDDCIVIQ